MSTFTSLIMLLKILNVSVEPIFSKHSLLLCLAFAVVLQRAWTSMALHSSASLRQICSSVLASLLTHASTNASVNKIQQLLRMKLSCYRFCCMTGHLEKTPLLSLFVFSHALAGSWNTNYKVSSSFMLSASSACGLVSVMAFVCSVLFFRISLKDIHKLALQLCFLWVRLFCFSFHFFHNLLPSLSCQFAEYLIWYGSKGKEVTTRLLFALLIINLLLESIVSLNDEPVCYSCGVNVNNV